MYAYVGNTVCKLSGFSERLVSREAIPFLLFFCFGISFASIGAMFSVFCDMLSALCPFSIGGTTSAATWLRRASIAVAEVSKLFGAHQTWKPARNSSVLWFATDRVSWTNQASCAGGRSSSIRAYSEILVCTGMSPAALRADSTGGI